MLLNTLTKSQIELLGVIRCCEPPLDPSIYQSVALRQTTRRSGFSAGEGAAANGSLTERRSSRQSANYVDGETERRSATTDATTHGNDGRQQRTAATADERLG